VIESVKRTPNQDISSNPPAKLESPEEPAVDDNGSISITAHAKYLYALRRSYISLYKTGLKKIWYNKKGYNEIKALLGDFTAEDAPLYGG
jgi:hypothetical protein